MDLLIRASIGGAVGVVLVWAVCRLVPRLTPATSATLWWCAAAKFLVALVSMAPIALPLLPSVESAALRQNSAAPGDAAGPVPTPQEAAGVQMVTGPASDATALLRSFVWPNGVLAIWGAGVSCAVLVGLRRWRLSMALVRGSTLAPEAAQSMAVELSTRLGLRRSPSVYLSNATRTPLVTGLLRPVVVLPAGTLADPSGEQARMAMCHELAHVRRGDLWLGCVPAAVECLFFFHPLARMAVKEYALCREAACDAVVMDVLEIGPRRYGQWLLDLGVARRDAGMAAAGASWSGSQLKRRLLMLGMPFGGSARTRLAATLAVAGVVVALMPFRLVARSQPVDAGPDVPDAPATAADDSGRGVLTGGRELSGVDSAGPVPTLAATTGVAPEPSRSTTGATGPTSRPTGGSGRDDAARRPQAPIVTMTEPLEIPADYVIGPEDILSIIFWGNEDMSTDVVVRPDGKIALPLVNDIQAAGLRPEELRTRVTEAAGRFVVSPVVMIHVREINSRRVFITGQVSNPSSYPLKGPTTVLQLIATAGGMLEYANANDILIVRREGGRQVAYRFNYTNVTRGVGLDRNIELKPGDTVVVP